MMDWDQVEKLAKEKLAAILDREGWIAFDDADALPGRNWSLYQKNGNRIRCYADAMRADSFSRFIVGYWKKIEAPEMSGVKRRLKVMIITGDSRLAVGIDESALLAKIAEVI